MPSKSTYGSPNHSTIELLDNNNQIITTFKTTKLDINEDILIIPECVTKIAIKLGGGTNYYGRFMK